MGRPFRSFTKHEDRIIRVSWKSSTLREIGLTIGAHPDTISRRARELKLPPRRSGRRSGPAPFQTITVPPGASSMYARLVGVLNREKVTLRRLAVLVGVTEVAVRSWATSNNPSLVNIERAFEVLGYELVPRKLISQKTKK